MKEGVEGWNRVFVAGGEDSDVNNELPPLAAVGVGDRCCYLIAFFPFGADEPVSW
jgi:hypothetical protein